MPSYNSSTVFCSLIRKISAKRSGRPRILSISGIDKIENRCYCEQKTRRQKSKKLLKQFLKLKTDEFPQEHFTMRFMKKCTFVYSFKKASHLRKKNRKIRLEWAMERKELDCCRLEESHMVGWIYFLSVAVALKKRNPQLSNVHKLEKKSVMRFRKKYIVIWYIYAQPYSSRDCCKWRKY